MTNTLTLAEKAYIQYKFRRHGLSPYIASKAIEYAESKTTFRINVDTIEILLWAVDE